MAERINLQYDYRNTLLMMELRKSEMIEMRRQIEANDIKILWEGMQYPVGILKVKHDIYREDYKRFLRNLNCIKDRLKNAGYTSEEIGKIGNGDFIKKDEK